MTPSLNHLVHLLLAVLLLQLVACTQSQSPETLDYIELLTAGAKPEETLPMIVVVHGLGDRPESFTEFMAPLKHKARIILPRGPTKWWGGYGWFSPQSNENWDELSPGIVSSARLLSGLIAELAESRPTRGRPIVTGFSQGGILSFALATSHPKAIQLAIPISGLLPKSLWPQKIDEALAYPDIRALHGEQDTVVPTDRARATVAYLKKIGLDASLDIYPRTPHSISLPMRKRVLGLINLELTE